MTTIPSLAALRLGERNIRIRLCSRCRTFAQASQIVSYSSTKDRKGSDNLISELRALRVLRGENILTITPQEAKKAGVLRFIFLSSIKVNGEFTLEEPFKADSKPKPEDPYGQSKYAAETELLKLHEPGKFEVVIIRPPLVYGPGVKANFASLLKLIQLRLPLPFSLVQNKRSYVSVYNLTDLIFCCLRHPAAAGKVFLVSDDEDLSLPALIGKISESLGIRPMLFPLPIWILNILTLPKKQIRLRLFSNLQVDIQKTKELLGWKPPFSVLSSLKKMNTAD